MSTDGRPEASPAPTGRRRNTVLAALEACREVGPDLTVNNIVSFLYVAENEGLNITELAHIAGLSHPTASRSVRSLAPGTDDGALPPYLGLVRLGEEGGLRGSRTLHLTAAGAALRLRIDRLICDAVPVFCPGRSPGAGGAAPIDVTRRRLAGAPDISPYPVTLEAGQPCRQSQ